VSISLTKILENPVEREAMVKFRKLTKEETRRYHQAPASTKAVPAYELLGKLKLEFAPDQFYARGGSYVLRHRFAIDDERGDVEDIVADLRRQVRGFVLEETFVYTRVGEWYSISIKFRID
jgi:hypothetical protein